VLNFEGRRVEILPGDSIASALFRAGTRTFSRSFKYHRRRGLYCLTGDCPNCLLNVDGRSHVRACVTPAEPGQSVSRESGWPSADRDLLNVIDHAHALVPVGFYYKTLLKPRWAWPRLEPWVRRIAASGAIQENEAPANREADHLHPDVAIVGGGVAGLSAALAAADAGLSVVICDEGRFGEQVAPGRVRDRIDQLAQEIRNIEAITIFERSPAIGIYEGPLVVVNDASLLRIVHPERVIVATGATDEHAVFPGNDLPGVWLARGAARLAGNHGIPPGARVVLVGDSPEADDHAETIERTGSQVTRVHGPVRRARGRRAVTGVVVETEGTVAELECDAIVLAVGLSPRSGLALQGSGLMVATIGDARQPGMPLTQAEREGHRAGAGAAQATPTTPQLPAPPREGVVCLCEDVTTAELEQAWGEGFRSSEILKRYTTATMGPCQGAMCLRHLQAFVAARPDPSAPGHGPTTARPPARPITLEEAAAGVRYEVHQHTSLHDRHIEGGALMEPAGPWQRPKHYGDVTREYWAVRRGISIMDVGTLGKFLVAGPDAIPFLEQLYPCHVEDLQPGGCRYALLLGEHGFVVDDGMICRLDENRWYLTFTSSGAATVEATLRDWADTWGHVVHIVDLTAVRGAINVAGPRARDLLERLSPDNFNADAFPYLSHHPVEVAGIDCLAIRLGFVGELSFELHHPSCLGPALWGALLAGGADLEVTPHGLDALRLLRLEKGHIIVGQDTDFDATPDKLNMRWAVKLEKPWFVGKPGIERARRHEPARKLVAVRFDYAAPPEGAPLVVDGQDIGYLSSSAWSPVLDCGVSLGWASRVDGSFPTAVTSEGIAGTVVSHAFYDPKGERVRG
jgi:sarcosine oxidase subunit alpha